MTTFVKPLKDRAAATIRAAVATTKVHAQKISQLESANAMNQATIATQAATITSQGSTITTLSGTVTSLSSTVSNLLSGNVTVGGTLQVNGSTFTLDGNALGATKLAYLTTLGQMNSISTQTFTGLGSSPSLTQANLDTVNNTLNALISLFNSLLSELQNSNYMN